jgi:hypothetical protein
MKGGNSTGEGLAILAILMVVILIIPKGSPSSKTGTSQGNSWNTSSVGGENVVSPKSPETKNISISTGNAAYAYQSYEEYITLYNRGRTPVDITGWQLKNGKAKRAYSIGGDLRYFPSDIALIPRATLFVSPANNNLLQNVVLESGETAIITTGSVALQSPYKIMSFKENICSGYLEDMPEYTFEPSLSRNCPRPADEIGVGGLDTECRNFIKGMSYCRAPEFETRDREGDICHNCVDGKPLASSCVAFIKNHFNYKSCIANHINDPEFSGKTWRIFLGKGWEMWAKQYETIELFDLLGKLVTSRSY